MSASPLSLNGLATAAALRASGRGVVGLVPALMIFVGYRGRMRSAAACTLADVCCVLAFVTIGRHTHGHADTAAGIWQTAWPFLAGLAVGLLAVRAWRRPASLSPAGLGAWIGAAGAGMVIRVLAGQGTAAAFVAVTFAFLGVFILGWRVVPVTARHLRRTRYPRSQRG